MDVVSTNNPRTELSAVPACPPRFFDPAISENLCLWSGLAIGTAGALIADLVGNLPSGYQLNDPLPLALSIGILLRGFLYFNYRNLVLAVVYSLVLGGFAGWLLARLAERKGRLVVVNVIGRTAKIAVIVSGLPVLIREIDAFQVLIYYGVSVWLSMQIASMSARGFVKLMSGLWMPGTDPRV